jgi:hypothetical protein
MCEPSRTIRVNEQSHEVSIMCLCGDIENCRMERYIADVRIAYAEIEQLKEKARLLAG